MKASLLNSLQYDGPLTVSVATKGEEEGGMVKNVETFSANPVTRKFVQTSKAKVLDPTTSQWTSAPEGKKENRNRRRWFHSPRIRWKRRNCHQRRQGICILWFRHQSLGSLRKFFQGFAQFAKQHSLQNGFLRRNTRIPPPVLENGWEPRHSFRCGHRGKKDTYRLILKGSYFA